MRTELEPHDHTCADGCCYTTKYDVFLNGKKIGQIVNEDPAELADLLNKTFTNSVNSSDRAPSQSVK